MPEGSGGTTSYTPDFDLQPTTRLYWRARMLQNGASSDWSTTRSLNTALVGYSRPGELYDPLVNGSTIGVAVGPTTFVAGKGIQLNDGNSYVRYQLQQPLAAGEFSMEVFGLHANYPGGKAKVFSMSDSTYDVYRSPCSSRNTAAPAAIRTTASRSRRSWAIRSSSSSRTGA